MKKIQQTSVGGAIFNSQGQVLFIRRSADETFMPGCWELPGGGSEWGESPQAALQREVMEECGIEIAVEKPLTTAHYIMDESDTSIHRVEIIFACTVLDESQQIQLNAESDMYQWLTPAEALAQLPMSEFMREIIQESLI